MKTTYKGIRLTYTKRGWYNTDNGEYFDSLEAAKEYIKENY